MAKIVVTVPAVPAEEDLITASGVILDTSTSADVIVFMQRVLRQTLAQVYAPEQTPAAEPEPTRRKRKGKDELPYVGDLAAGIPAEEI